MTFTAFRFHLFVVGALLVPFANGRDAKASKGETVPVCGTWTGLEGPDVTLGQQVSSQILDKAGIHLEWRNRAKDCTLPGGVIISTSAKAPATTRPGAVASAMAFEGTHIVVFVDRLVETFRRDQVAYVLGHVIAHEIVHILQRLDRHSKEGLMKAQWQAHDYVQMRRTPMVLLEEDVRLGHFPFVPLASGLSPQVSSPDTL